MILEDYRKRIDKVDDELLRLINLRAQMVVEIERMKQEADLPLEDLEREKWILDRIDARNMGPLCKLAVRNVFYQIINECKFGRITI